MLGSVGQPSQVSTVEGGLRGTDYMKLFKAISLLCLLTISACDKQGTSSASTAISQSTLAPKVETPTVSNGADLLEAFQAAFGVPSPALINVSANKDGTIPARDSPPFHRSPSSTSRQMSSPPCPKETERRRITTATRAWARWSFITLSEARRVSRSSADGTLTRALVPLRHSRPVDGSN